MPSLPEYAVARSGNCRVLLAEDHVPSAHYAGAVLEMADCDVTWVVNGKEALSQWRGERFDLLLLDVHMPMMDGLAVLREIRATERETGGDRSPIVAITASALPDEVRACFDAGADDVLVKPFLINDLRRMLRRWPPRDT